MPARSDVGQFGQLLGSEPSYYAAWLASEGYASGTIFDNLLERFPNLPESYLASAAAAGELAADAGARFPKMPGGRSIPIGAIPIDPNLSSGFRYLATVACFDSSGYNPIFRSFVIDSPDNLTKNELKEAGKQAFRSALGTARYTFTQLQCDSSNLVFASLNAVFRSG
jgi:hypothetical protein